MVKCIDHECCKWTRHIGFLRWIQILGVLILCGSTLSIQAAPRKIPALRAHISGVEQSFVSQGTPRVSGAGLRFFQAPDTETSGTERFDVRWYANPPGIPPGAIVMLETVQERSARIKNHVVRTTGKSEGNIQSIIEIPPADIRQAGRTVQWRVRIIWRGRSLASRTSSNWEG